MEGRGGACEREDAQAGVGGHRPGPGEYLKEGRPRRSRDRVQALGERAVETRSRGD